MTGGLEIVRTTESFDTRWGDLTARSRKLEVVSAKSWLIRTESDGGQTLVSWCDGKEIGIFSKAFQLLARVAPRRRLTCSRRRWK